MQQRMTPEEHRRFVLYVGTVVIAAVVMLVAPPVIQWLTGLNEYSVSGTYRYCSKDPNNLGSHKAPDEVCLPKQMSGIFDKLINGLRALGGIILVVGLIWSGIKLQVVPKRKFKNKRAEKETRKETKGNKRNKGKITVNS